MKNGRQDRIAETLTDESMFIMLLYFVMDIISMLIFVSVKSLQE